MNLTANLYLKLIRGGAAALAARRQEINDLNVFPIPDGDTGDNMFMTIDAGASVAPSSSGLSRGSKKNRPSKACFFPNDYPNELKT